MSGTLIHPIGFTCGGSEGGGGPSFTALEDSDVDLTYLKVVHSFTRRVLTSYTGNLIEIRRDSDDATENIGATSEWLLDEAAISDFCGAANGYVRTVYDQTSNSYNATQTGTLSKQPMIWDGAAIVKTTTMGSAHPGAHFDQDWMNCTFTWGNRTGAGGPNLLVGSAIEVLSYRNSWTDTHIACDGPNGGVAAGTRQGNTKPLLLDFGWTNWIDLDNDLTVPVGRIVTARPFGAHSNSSKRMVATTLGWDDASPVSSRLTGFGTNDGVCYGNNKVQTATNWSNHKQCEFIGIDDHSTDANQEALMDWMDAFYGVRS